MKKKILIADDDMDFVQLLREGLERAGYETVAAYEGIRTVELAHREKPDLILLDWKMPTGKGDTVLKNLAAREDTRSIPVIIVTGAFEPDIEEKAKTFGVRAFFRKPYDARQLLEKIKEVLNGKTDSHR